MVGGAGRSLVVVVVVVVRTASLPHAMANGDRNTTTKSAYVFMVPP
jgi:hypothetical protein